MREQTLKETLNLPKTAFPMKAELVRREQERLQKWDEVRLYEKIQEKNANNPRFCSTTVRRLPTVMCISEPR